MSSVLSEYTAPVKLRNTEVHYKALSKIGVERNRNIVVCTSSVQKEWSSWQEGINKENVNKVE